MAIIKDTPQVKLEVTLVISESEARALDGLTGYDIDEFLKVFYLNMGRHYLSPHETGLREFFKSVRQLIPPQLRRVDEARAVFKKETP